MNRWLKVVFPPDAEVASIPLVFLTVSIVTLVQLPAHYLLNTRWLSAGIFINEIVAVAGVPIFFVWWQRFDRRRLFPLGMPAAVTVALVIIATFGADIVIDYLTAASEHFFPLPDRVSQALGRLLAADTTLEIVGKGLVLCAVPAICEELFFRGYCQTSIAAKWGARWGIVATAGIFAVLHGNPWYVHLYFLLGLLLGWIFYATGSLWMAILCHFLNNAWTFLNHARNFHLPLEPPFGAADLVVLAMGAVVFACAAMVLTRSRAIGKA